jgi:hypothetical protein
MNADWLRRGAVLLVVGALACSENPDGKGHAGAASQASSGGATSGGNSSMGGLTLMVSAGTSGVASIPLQPAAGVDLQKCGDIAIEGGSQAVGDCFLCCIDAGLPNNGFFQGRCACKSETTGGDVCAAQGTDGTACSTCCTDKSFSRASFSPGPPAECGCSARQDAKVCSAQVGDPNCAVCCINAGYVSHYSRNNTCICADG